MVNKPRTGGKRNKHGLGRTIPKGVVQDVRRACGFGCVFCGRSFIQYEHIEAFKDVKTHDPAKLALVCGTHHDEITRGMRSKQSVWEARAKPFALEQGFARYDGLDYKSGDDLVVTFGAARITNPQSILVVNGESLFSIERGECDGAPLKLFARFYDAFGRDALFIDDNMYTVFNRELLGWDFTHEGKVVSITDRHGESILRVRFEPRECIVVERLRMYFLGHNFTIEDGVLTVTNSKGIGTAYSDVELRAMTHAFVIDQFSMTLGLGGGSTRFSASPIRSAPRVEKTGEARVRIDGISQSAVLRMSPRAWWSGFWKP